MDDGLVYFEDLVVGSTASFGRCGFVDVAAAVAHHLGLTERGPGRSFL